MIEVRDGISSMLQDFGDFEDLKIYMNYCLK